MATQKEYKSILAPVLAKFPGWVFSQGWITRTPIGFYKRGCVFNGSFSSRAHCQVVRCVYPLFESPRIAHISWGWAQSIPGVCNFGWSIFEPEFADKVIRLMEETIIPATEHVDNGAAFLDYLERQNTPHGWPEWGKALAHVHMDNLDTAQELLAKPAGIIRKDFPELQQPDSWGGDLLEMLRLLEHDRDAIPAHCEAITRRAVKANKLEKHWTPTPFVYGGS